MANLNKCIKVQQTRGLEYVEVYVVVLVTLEGREIDYMYYFSRADAFEDVSFMRSKFGDKYLRIYCESKLVWL